MASGDLEAAAQALAGAANKAVTPGAVAEVNRNLGIESTPEEEAQVAAQAEAARTAAPTEEDAEADEADLAEEDDLGEDATGEESGEIASAADDLIEIGRASGRERVGQYWWISVVARTI